MINRKNRRFLPDHRVSVGLGKSVQCPRCGERGTLIARVRGKKQYLYVQHKRRGRIKECYVGPARFYFLPSVGRRPLVHVYCEAGSNVISVRFVVPEELELDLADPNVLRQVHLDYYALLLWLKELIEKEVEKVGKGFGITEEEARERLSELKKEYASLIFYRKIL